MPRIYNRMKVQVKLAGGRAQYQQQNESSGKQARGRAQDLKQDKSPGEAGRRACSGLRSRINLSGCIRRINNTVGTKCKMSTM
jgi:hypothetical protein